MTGWVKRLENIFLKWYFCVKHWSRSFFFRQKIEKERVDKDHQHQHKWRQNSRARSRGFCDDSAKSFLLNCETSFICNLLQDRESPCLIVKSSLLSKTNQIKWNTDLLKYIISTQYLAWIAFWLANSLVFS